MGKKKRAVKKGKKPHKNKPASKKYSKYKIEGNNITRAPVCPRCGPAIFLMVAKDRLYCGKCHYSEFLNKSSDKSGSQSDNKSNGSVERGE